VLLQIVVEPQARVGEQHLLDEFDRRGRAFDVQQDRANAGQRNGM
jgi:DNA phosphorothioation-dependent restriction protein DptG